ncbi:OmpA family protein [Ferrimonas sediminicola]|uniref:OmpA family protein n=1 Tax=Ferrimonas sediminicola TaxID=2569538 RepID=A0A4U1BE67_9GAMM|nr:OmpA family protein [Ferrimonas sediminicola]TKB49326.1 OmpA family protein [Ferrimonas sediminicola]
MTFIIRYLYCTLLLAAPAGAADRDGDGVPDSKDACPETRASLASSNGCPVQANHADRVVLLFDSGSARLGPSQLRALRGWMTGWQGQKLLIRGHADERGMEGANLVLSRARAQAVVRVLTLEFGVDADRLSLQALGEREPLKDSPNGLAASRRVEVVASPITLELTKGE